ncbi:hypothetical protein TNCV_1670281 [Trichonephila clavipes]|nr:hypothetical protein TNCV_1670281 [Trichonephila clavipes]
MSSGHSLPQINLSVLGGTQGGSRKMKEAHEIHCGKGLEVRLSLALALNTIQKTVRISSAKFPKRTIDGDTTYLHLPNFAMGLEVRETFSSPPCTRDSAHKTFGPTDLTSTYSVCSRRVNGGIGHRTQAYWSGVRCSNHYGYP